MKITEETVRHIATLGRLQLAPEELKRFTEQLDQVLEYFTKLDELDVTGVEPTSYAVPLTCRMRADITQPSALREQMLKPAPRSEEGHFVVPKVID